MTLIAVTETKALNTLISGVKSSGKAFEAKLHLAAFSCLTVAAGGDVRPLTRLYDALNGRVLKTALAAWANAFGSVKVTEATDEAPATVAYAKSKVADLAMAAAVPVSDYKPATSGKESVFELAAKLRSTIKNATKDGVKLTSEETRALGLVEQALAMLDPEFKPTSNVVAMPKAKTARKAKSEEQIAA